MNEKDGGPAFPCSDVDSCGNERQRFTGMALRDYFAAHALAALAHNQNTNDPKDNAESAWKIADAMLEARGKK